MIEKREKLCYGVDGLRKVKAESDHGVVLYFRARQRGDLPYPGEITKSSNKEATT